MDFEIAAGDERGVAAGIARARESVPLFLAAEATRHLSRLLEALGGGLPAPELGALARGERVGAVALADAAEAPARLARAAGGWRLSGRKSFVTNAPSADWIAVFAEAEEGEALCLLSPRDPGVRVGEPMALLGLDGLPVAEVELLLAAPPPERVLGPFPDRAASRRYALDADLSLAVAACGLMRGVLAAASGEAHRRQRGGRPLFARQEVAFRLAEVLALAEAAELLCHRAAWLAARGDPEAATVVRCAKVFCTESAERAASAGLQVLGGEGYRRGSVAERAYRDAKGLELAGTTVEVARMAIADALLAG
jgi:alkylation response protein AidB-like acyl-CoA dehydrogenase